MEKENQGRVKCNLRPEHITTKGEQQDQYTERNDVGDYGGDEEELDKLP